MRDKNWDNQERRRYYGLRVGDTVTLKGFGDYLKENLKVVEYGFMDNNAVYVQGEDDDEPYKAVAEWCTITKKVDDE